MHTLYRSLSWTDPQGNPDQRWECVEVGIRERQGWDEAIGLCLVRFGLVWFGWVGFG